MSGFLRTRPDFISLWTLLIRRAREERAAPDSPRHIEHMPDPAADVRELRRLLRPGGVLVVETPRFDSLMFKLMGRRERSLNNCPGHIYFFTVGTLSKLGEKCGFEVARVELVGRTLTVDRLLTNVGIMTQSRRLTGWLGRMGSKLGLDRVRIHVNARDMQRIYFRAR